MALKEFIPTARDTRGRGAPITLSQRRFNAFGGYPTLFMGSVFAYSGTAFGRLSSLRVYTQLSSMASIRQFIRNTVFLAGPTAVGVAIGVKIYGNPNELALLIKDGDKYADELDSLRQELLLPCPS